MLDVSVILAGYWGYEDVWWRKREAGRLFAVQVWMESGVLMVDGALPGLMPCALAASLVKRRASGEIAAAVPWLETRERVNWGLNCHQNFNCEWEFTNGWIHKFHTYYALIASRSNGPICFLLLVTSFCIHIDDRSPSPAGVPCVAMPSTSKP